MFLALEKLRSGPPSSLAPNGLDQSRHFVGSIFLPDLEQTRSKGYDHYETNVGTSVDWHQS